MSAVLTVRTPTATHFLASNAACLCATGLQKSLDEKIVDVDSNIVMIEREIDGAGVIQAVALRTIFHHVAIPAGLTIQKEGPALLKKSEKELSVRDDLFKRPVLEKGCAV